MQNWDEDLIDLSDDLQNILKVDMGTNKETIDIKYTDKDLVPWAELDEENVKKYQSQRQGQHVQQLHHATKKTTDYNIDFLEDDEKCQSPSPKYIKIQDGQRQNAKGFSTSNILQPTIISSHRTNQQQKNVIIKNEDLYISDYEALNNYSHVLEAVDLNRNADKDIFDDYLEEFRLVRVPKPKIIWVNNEAALIVCSDEQTAKYLQSYSKDTIIKIKLRPFYLAGQEARETRRPSLEPPIQVAPKKNATIAQRIIAHHLNLKVDHKSTANLELEEQKQRNKFSQRQKDIINKQIQQSQYSSWDND